jgi:hypothetical protein
VARRSEAQVEHGARSTSRGVVRLGERGRFNGVGRMRLRERLSKGRSDAEPVSETSTVFASRLPRSAPRRVAFDPRPTLPRPRSPPTKPAQPRSSRARSAPRHTSPVTPSAPRAVYRSATRPTPRPLHVGVHGSSSTAVRALGPEQERRSTRRGRGGSGAPTPASASQVMPVSRSERKPTCSLVAVFSVSLGRVTSATLMCARNVRTRSRRASTWRIAP